MKKKIKVFGSAKIHGIEYWNLKTKKWQYTTIKDLRLLTILGCHKDVDLGRWNTGHNLSIIFGQDQKEAYEDLCSMFGQPKYFPIPLYLCGENSIKIPVLCSEGNNWMKLDYDEETACLFVYLPAMIFDNKFDNCEYNHSTFNYKEKI